MHEQNIIDRFSLNEIIRTSKVNILKSKRNIIQFLQKIDKDRDIYI